MKETERNSITALVVSAITTFLFYKYVNILELFGVSDWWWILIFAVVSGSLFNKLNEQSANARVADSNKL